MPIRLLVVGQYFETCLTKRRGVLLGRSHGINSVCIAGKMQNLAAEVLVLPLKAQTKPRTLPVYSPQARENAPGREITEADAYDFVPPESFASKRQFAAALPVSEAE